MISGSDLAGPPSAWSASNKIRARTNLRAAPFPDVTNDRNCCRSSAVNVTR